jgi:hypothetical protein
VLGFTATGRELLTATQEGEYISGEHSVRVWEVGTRALADGPGAAREVALAASPPRPLEETATAAAPGAADHEVRYLRPAAGKAGAGRVEVRRLDLRNGEVSTAGAFEGTFRATRFTPAAERVVGFTEGGAVECYTADGGKRLWASGPPPDRPAGRVVLGQGQEVPNVTLVAVARDGSCVLAVHRTPVSAAVLLAGDTGKALPTPEGIDRVAGIAAAVSGDGRLAALSYAPLVDIGARAGSGKVLVYAHERPRLSVWETATGRVVRSWLGSASALAFHPTRPVLAVLEPTPSGSRLGLWDFSAQP